MPLLLTLNTFYTLFWCYHSWFWVSKCGLGSLLSLVKVYRLFDFFKNLHWPYNIRSTLGTYTQMEYLLILFVPRFRHHYFHNLHSMLDLTILTSLRILFCRYRPATLFLFLPQTMRHQFPLINWWICCYPTVIILTVSYHWKIFSHFSLIERFEKTSFICLATIKSKSYFQFCLLPSN